MVNVRTMPEADCQAVSAGPARPNTVAGLIEKRREIAGRIEHAQRALRQLLVEWST